VTVFFLHIFNVDGFLTSGFCKRRWFSFWVGVRLWCEILFGFMGKKLMYWSLLFPPESVFLKLLVNRAVHGGCYVGKAMHFSIVYQRRFLFYRTGLGFLVNART
jgi:hypothetical protein